MESASKIHQNLGISSLLWIGSCRELPLVCSAVVLPSPCGSGSGTSEGYFRTLHCERPDSAQCGRAGIRDSYSGDPDHPDSQRREECVTIVSAGGREPVVFERQISSGGACFPCLKYGGAGSSCRCSYPYPDSFSDTGLFPLWCHFCAGFMVLSSGILRSVQDSDL